MDQAQLNWITNFIWGIADDCLRDVFVRGKYRDVVLPMTVLQRLGNLFRTALEHNKNRANKDLKRLFPYFLRIE